MYRPAQIAVLGTLVAAVASKVQIRSQGEANLTIAKLGLFPAVSVPCGAVVRGSSRAYATKAAI
jgi:hypothetical protein